MIDKADYTPAIVPIRTEPVQQRSTQRITALLDAAADLIDEVGIDGLTTSDVAARSQSSVGVVYRYFPNIQSLLRALAARNMDRFTDRVFGAPVEESAHWGDALDTALDTYVDLMRNEPGFRALGFGDVIDKRFVQINGSNNSVIARAFEDMLVTKYGVAPSEDLSTDLDIVVEIGDALLHRAFLYERRGDERFIVRLRSIVKDYMAPHRALR